MQIQAFSAPFLALAFLVLLISIAALTFVILKRARKRRLADDPLNDWDGPSYNLSRRFQSDALGDRTNELVEELKKINRR